MAASCSSSIVLQRNDVQLWIAAGISTGMLLMLLLMIMMLRMVMIN